MSAFLYAVALQWRLDIRSKTLLITCYLVPLLFFAIMGGIFTAITPETKDSLIASMTVMGISMGAMIGLPPSLAELYGSDIKKAYQANGIPIGLGITAIFLSAWIHLFLMSVIIYLIAPVAFDALLPVHSLRYFGSLALFLTVSLSVGGVLGLSVKNQAKLTMVSQLVFLPSIMLSGILFPVGLLPDALKFLGKIFPASWGYRLMLGDGSNFLNILPLLVIFFAAGMICVALLRRRKV